MRLSACLLIMIKGLITTAIVLGGIAIFYCYFMEKIDNVETQQYALLAKDGPIEIRTYGKSLIAKTAIKGNYKEASNRGFQKLAGYIFGGNEKQKQIAMTSPVWMSGDSKEGEMHFMMPSGYDSSDLPTPQDKSVMIDNFEGGKFASITFSGYANDEKINKYKNKLTSWLNENKYDSSGKVFYAGYDAPFKVYSRRNEVLIAL
jgi:effector-binding domain-containing protein